MQQVNSTDKTKQKKDFPSMGTLVVACGKNADNYSNRLNQIVKQINNNPNASHEIKAFKNSIAIYAGDDLSDNWYHVSNDKTKHLFGLGHAYFNKNHHSKNGSLNDLLLNNTIEQTYACWHNLEGRFVLGRIDENTGNLKLRTDPYAQYQLFKISKFGLHIFSSSIKVLLAILDEFTINLASIKHYLFLNYPILPNTFYNEITVLKPGYQFEISPNNTLLSTKIVHTNVPQDYFETLNEYIDYHSIPEAPLWHLSGGVDSTLLCRSALVNQNEISTITAYYTNDDGDFNYGKKEAKSMESNHNLLKINTANYVEDLKKIISIMNSPIMAVGVMTFYELARDANKMKFKTSISGIGGDHIFTGYTKMSQLQTTTPFATYSNVKPNEVKHFFEESIYNSMVSQLEKDIEKASKSAAKNPESIEAFYRSHFVHEHLRMTHSTFAHFSTVCESPFLHLGLVKKGITELKKDNNWKDKSFLRNRLMQIKSHDASRRNLKEQMALQGTACIKHIAPDYLKYIEDKKIQVKGLNYSQIKQALIYPNQLSKSQSRFLWITYNLHVWLKLVGSKSIDLKDSEI